MESQIAESQWLHQLNEIVGGFGAAQEFQIIRRPEGGLACLFVPKAEHVQRTVQLLYEKRTAEWAELFDEVISQNFFSDPQFYINGWSSSYTHQALAPGEMQAWVQATVKRIEELRPQRLLEIGCGTGLLLFRLAASCQHYAGVDFSAASLGHIEKHLGNLKSRVSLHLGKADQLSALAGLKGQVFDTVVLNSVAQYFPDASYFFAVLDQAMALAGPGAKLFLGDLRDLRLLDQFHFSLALFQAELSASRQEIAQAIEAKRDSEAELAIDPRLFLALSKRYPRIRGVELLVKDGRYCNELNKYRYDVVLTLDEAPAQASGAALLSKAWLQEEPVQEEALLKKASEEGQDTLLLRGLPNRRVWSEARAWELWQQQASLEVVRAELKKDQGYEPAAFWAAQSQGPWQLRVLGSWQAADCFDVLLSKARVAAPANSQTGALAVEGNWEGYFNQPLQKPALRQLAAELRAFLKKQGVAAGSLPQCQAVVVLPQVGL